MKATTHDPNDRSILGVAIRRLLRVGLLAVAGALAGACGGSGGGSGGGNAAPPPPPPPPPTVTRVAVTPSIASVTVGQTVALSAQAFDANNNVLTRTFTWASSDTGKATVDANGVVTGVAAGSVSITASADAVTSAPSALTVSAVATTTQSSAELIDAALAAGTLTAETALTYKVFAAFGDTRLPAQYQGNDVDQIDADVITQLYDQWSTLSQAAQDALEPFTVPPAYQGSWTSLPSASPHVLRTLPKSAPKILASGGVRTQSVNVPICRQPQLDPNWAAKPETSTGRVKVWYDKRVPGMDLKASIAVDELETKIWPTVTGTAAMRAPLSDGALDGCNGGDGRLDIYLVDGLIANGANLGETNPLQYASDNFPTFILIRPSLDTDEMKGTLAHEFTHASQWAYNVAGFSVRKYQWLMEATAQAMIDIVYPNLPRGTTTFLNNCKAAQFEQCVASRYFETPDRSLEDDSLGAFRTYGSYLFFQFLTRTVSTTTIAQIWSQTESQSKPLDAVDKGIPGGFKDQWPKFAKLLWNQDPVNTNSFQGWDALALTPTLKADPLKIDLGGQPAGVWELDGNIRHLASHYYQFSISDPNVRSLAFFNHALAFLPSADATVNPPVSVQAFYKKAGGIWEYDHWSDEAFQVDGVKSFCIDVAAERITDLVIVMSNRDPKADITALPKAPAISASNIGCWRYTGSASVTATGATPVWTSLSQSGDGSVTFERYRPPQLPNGTPGKEMFQVVQGAITGHLNGTNVAGCTVTENSSDNMSVGLASGQLMVDLGVYLGSEPLSRAVSGTGNAMGQTHTVVACPGADPQPSDGQVAWDWFELPSATEMKVEVKPDGTIQGTFPRVVTNADGTSIKTQMIWNFTPQRQ